MAKAKANTWLDEPGWLRCELAAAAAEVAIYPEAVVGPVTAVDDQTLIRSIALWAGRVAKLQAEAFRRGLV
jgi:hypothetical protein